MTRKVIRSFFALASGVFLIPSVGYAWFTDVSENHPAFKAIRYIDQNDTPLGSTIDMETFRPDDLISKGEFYGFLMSTLSEIFPEIEKECAWHNAPFKSHPYSHAICMTWNMGIDSSMAYDAEEAYRKNVTVDFALLKIIQSTEAILRWKAPIIPLEDALRREGRDFLVSRNILTEQQIEEDTLLTRANTASLLMAFFGGENPSISPSRSQCFPFASSALTTFQGIKTCFTDVPEDHLYQKEIWVLSNARVIDGFDDGTLRPDGIVNRAEFLKMFIGAYHFNLRSDPMNKKEYAPVTCVPPPFSDIEPDAWYIPYLCIAVKKGMIQGHSDGTFRPGEPVTFAEAAKIMTSHVIRRKADADPWYEPYVDFANAHRAYPPSVHGAGQQLNRGEIAFMIDGLMSTFTPEYMKTMCNMPYKQMYIPRAAATPEIRNQLSYESRLVRTDAGVFAADILFFDIKGDLEILTVSPSECDCLDDCPTKSLETYIKQSGAIAGINGTYFCTEDYAQCHDRKNWFPYYMLNSSLNTHLNSDMFNIPDNYGLYTFRSLPPTQKYGTYISFAQDSHAHLPSDRRPWISGAIASEPVLMYKGELVLDESSLTDVQLRSKTSRAGIGHNRDTVYLVMAREATIPDLAAIMQALNLEGGVALDGGGSSALYLDGRYIFGPGRDLPNAILIAPK